MFSQSFTCHCQSRCHSCCHVLPSSSLSSSPSSSQSLSRWLPSLRGGSRAYVLDLDKKMPFWDPFLNVKMVAEHPRGVVFVGGFVKIPSKCKHTCSTPLQKHLEKCSLHFGHVPLKTLVMIYYMFRYAALAILT